MAQRPVGRGLAILAAAALGASAALAACGPTPSPSPGVTASAAPSASVPAPSPGSSPTASAAASRAVDPSRFGAVIDNPWFPLTPGTTLKYSGIKDGDHVTEVFQVTTQTVVIDGVRCVVVHDNLYSAGVLLERTSDWYAQDLDGNVWYFGEDTAELDETGAVTSTEGSWKAGVDGASPGIYMPASPAVGQSLQQEVFTDHAEDRFVVLQVGIPVKARAGSFDQGLITLEWTVLEPGVISTKTYARGIGEISERDLTGGDEHLELVSVPGS